MIETILLCASYIWLSPGNWVEYYLATVDDEIHATLFPVLTPLVEICGDDNLPHVIRIRAVDANYERLEITDPDAPRVIQSDYARHPLPVAVKADLNGDGIVRLDDFGMFVRAYGKCNRDLREVPCD